MHIIKRFIEKIKQLVQACKDWKSRREIEKWYFENEVTDEQLRLDREQMIADYQQQCKGEDERIAKQHKKIMDEILEAQDRCLARQMEEWSMQEEWEKRFDNEKDERNDNPLDMDETTLINRQCAEVDPEEEVPLWLEHTNEKCSKCRLLPEFCQSSASVIMKSRGCNNPKTRLATKVAAGFLILFFIKSKYIFHKILL